MPCAGRFGKDAVDYAKGLAMGHSSCEQQALKEMLDLLSRCEFLTLCGHIIAKNPETVMQPHHALSVLDNLHLNP